MIHRSVPKVIVSKSIKTYIRLQLCNYWFAGATFSDTHTSNLFTLIILGMYEYASTANIYRLLHGWWASTSFIHTWIKIGQASQPWGNLFIKCLLWLTFLLWQVKEQTLFRIPLRDKSTKSYKDNIKVRKCICF